MSSQLPQEHIAQAGALPRRESERLRDCSHLVALLADQLEAMEQGDFPRLREIGAMRERLAGEVREGSDGDVPLLRFLTERVEDALHQVEAWVEQSRRSRDELTHLQDESLPLIRGIDRRTGKGSYRSMDGGAGKLDVRL